LISANSRLMLRTIASVVSRGDGGKGLSIAPHSACSTVRMGAE
jgi:hypothetical protein